ncbi:MAG: hypothetical protein R6U94_13315 [Nitriliruptoraceae bacterium]
MADRGPPAYAWDWFARQKLLWRAARSRLAASPSPMAVRYAAVEDRRDVLPLLKADYPQDEDVRHAVDEVVAEVAFLGRIDVRFSQLGVRSAPRGMRWWWTALTGEVLDGPRAAEHATSRAPEQLLLDGLTPLDAEPALDDVAGGYGDRRH